MSMPVGMVMCRAPSIMRLAQRSTEEHRDLGGTGGATTPAAPDAMRPAQQVQPRNPVPPPAIGQELCSMAGRPARRHSPLAGGTGATVRASMTRRPAPAHPQNDERVDERVQDDDQLAVLVDRVGPPGTPGPEAYVNKYVRTIDSESTKMPKAACRSNTT